MLVVVAMAFLLSGVKSEVQEPQCMSYFDFEQKLLYKMIYVEEEVKKFRAFIEELKNDQDKNVREQEEKLEATLAKFENDAKREMDDRIKKATEQEEKLEATLAKFENDAKQEKGDLEVKSNKVVADLENKLSDLTEATEKMKKVQAVGFTMKAPKESPTSRQLTFSTVVSNVDDAFDVTSGIFSCKIPGYYYFSASLLKHYHHVSNTHCYIRKNGNNLVIAYTQAGHSPNKGYYAAVNSVYVHLNTGDTVTLAGCTEMSSLYEFSSFSGFLVSPDII